MSESEYSASSLMKVAENSARKKINTVEAQPQHHMTVQATDIYLHLYLMNYKVRRMRKCEYNGDGVCLSPCPRPSKIGTSGQSRKHLLQLFRGHFQFTSCTAHGKDESVRPQDNVWPPCAVLPHKVLVISSWVRSVVTEVRAPKLSCSSWMIDPVIHRFEGHVISSLETRPRGKYCGLSV